MLGPTEVVGGGGGGPTVFASVTTDHFDYTAPGQTDFVLSHGDPLAVLTVFRRGILEIGWTLLGSTVSLAAPLESVDDLNVTYIFGTTPLGITVVPDEQFVYTVPGQTQFTLANVPYAILAVFRLGILEVGWSVLGNVLTIGSALAPGDDLVVAYLY